MYRRPFCGQFAVYKNTTDNKLKKKRKTFSSLKNNVHVEPVWFSLDNLTTVRRSQARNQDFMWGGANEAKVDQTTEMYFLMSDPFI